MNLLKFINYSLFIKNKNHQNPLLLNVNFDINEGDTVLLTAPNGAGKSTILAELTGYDYRYIDNNSSIVRSGDVEYKDSNNQAILLNPNGRNNEIFQNDYVFISQDDEQSFPLVLDCFTSSIVKKNKKPIKEVFEFVKNNRIYESVIHDDKKVSLNLRCKKLLTSIEQDISDGASIKTAEYLLTKVKSLSGGQLKFLNIMSNLVKYRYSRLVLIDEPLNNLDYESVRRFCNILTGIHNECPKLAFLIVTHCQSIPIINRVLEIDPKTKTINEIANADKSDICKSCFGKIEKGYYI